MTVRPQRDSITNLPWRTTACYAGVLSVEREALIPGDIVATQHVGGGYTRRPCVKRTIQSWHRQASRGPERTSCVIGPWKVAGRPRNPGPPGDSPGAKWGVRRAAMLLGIEAGPELALAVVEGEREVLEQTIAQAAEGRRGRRAGRWGPSRSSPAPRAVACRKGRSP